MDAFQYSSTTSARAGALRWRRAMQSGTNLADSVCVSTKSRASGLPLAKVPLAVSTVVPIVLAPMMFHQMYLMGHCRACAAAGTAQ